MNDIVDLYVNQKKTIKEIYESIGGSYGGVRNRLLKNGIRLRRKSKRRGKSDIEKFSESYIPEPMSGCWIWVLYTDKRGYGYFWIKDRKHTAHRASLMLLGLEVPNDMEVDHICKNRSCVNPKHWRVVTKKENLSFRDCGPKIFCMKGHRYTSENTILER